MKRKKTLLFQLAGFFLAIGLFLAPDCRAEEYFWAPDEYSDDFFLLRSTYYPIRGDGSVGLPTSFGYCCFQDREVVAKAVADMDGDGDNDLLVQVMFRGYFGGGSVILFSNNGDGTFAGREIGIVSPQNLTFPDFRTMNVADFNGDGRLDIVCANSYGIYYSYLQIYLQNEQGDFELSSTTDRLLNQTAFIPVIQVGDMTGDGFVDIVLLSAITYDVYLCENDGTGTFTSFRLIEGNTKGWGSAFTGFVTSGLALLDVDNDGDLDVIYGGGRGNYSSPYPLRYVVRLNDGTGQFILGPIPLIEFPRFSNSGHPAALETTDFDHDGYIDLLVNRVDTRSIEYLRNNGSGLPTPFDESVALYSLENIPLFNYQYEYVPILASPPAKVRSAKALVEKLNENFADVPVTIFTNLNHATTFENKLTAVLDLLNSVDETTPVDEKLAAYSQAIEKMENDLQPKICGSTSKKQGNTWLFPGDEQAQLCAEVQKIIDALQKEIDSLSGV